MTVNAQLLDILGPSPFVYSDATQVTPTASIAKRINNLLAADTLPIKRTSCSNTFWDANNEGDPAVDITTGTGSEPGANGKGLGGSGVVNYAGLDSGNHTDISAWIASALTGGYILTMAGLADMVLRETGELYTYWGSEAAAIAGAKDFLISLKAMGKIVVFCSSYPLGNNTLEGYALTLYAALEAWLPANGMYYIDLNTWCREHLTLQLSNSRLPAGYLDSGDVSYNHISGTGAEAFAAYVYGEIGKIFNVAARI